MPCEMEIWCSGQCNRFALRKTALAAPSQELTLHELMLHELMGAAMVATVSRAEPAGVLRRQQCQQIARASLHSASAMKAERG